MVGWVWNNEPIEVGSEATQCKCLQYDQKRSRVVLITSRACLRSPAASQRRPGGRSTLQAPRQPPHIAHLRVLRREPPPSRSAPPPPLTCTLGEHLRRRRQGSGAPPSLSNHPFLRREPPPSRSAPPPPLTCTLGENLRRRRQGSGAPPSLANHPFLRPNSAPSLRTPTNRFEWVSGVHAQRAYPKPRNNLNQIHVGGIKPSASSVWITTKHKRP